MASTGLLTDLPIFQPETDEGLLSPQSPEAQPWCIDFALTHVVRGHRE